MHRPMQICMRTDGGAVARKLPDAIPGKKTLAWMPRFDRFKALAECRDHCNDCLLCSGTGKEAQPLDHFGAGRVAHAIEVNRLMEMRQPVTTVRRLPDKRAGEEH